MPPNIATAAPAADAATTDKAAKYTWQEVAKHNTASSCWVILGDGVYDLTEFLPKHPGGQEMLLLAAGRDCTELFDMYHVFNEESARKYLPAYRIGSLTGPTEFPRYAPDASGFWRTLKGRVVDHFRSTGKDPRSPWTGLVRVIPMYIVFAALFAVVHGGVWGDCPTAVKIMLTIPLGILQVLPLMHWMHDASHGSIGGRETWWKVLGRVSMELTAGANMMPWHHQHIIGHHVLTNVYGADPDLPDPNADAKDPRFLAKAQPWTWLYRYQHIYLPWALYGLLAINIRVQDFTHFIFKKTNGPVRVNWYDSIWVRIVGGKIAWLAWRAGIPLLVWNQALLPFLGYMLLTDIFSGFWLAHNFQVSHITEDMSWPNANGEGQMVLPDSWAENQVKTSLGYQHGDPVWAYMSGALNYQLEHHLFPGISQYHLPAIAPIVKQACKEYGLPYRYEETFFDAIRSHLRHLQRMGAEGKAAHMD